MFFNAVHIKFAGGESKKQKFIYSIKEYFLQRIKL